MKEINVVSIEKHKINNEDIVLMAIKRKHRYEDLSDSHFTFYLENKKVVLQIDKNKKTKKYILNIKDTSIPLINISSFMMLELSDTLGDINYIVDKKL
jgi:hypothetical protein